MAGLSDHCPKCNAFVTAPAQAPTPVAAPAEVAAPLLDDLGPFMPETEQSAPVPESKASALSQAIYGMPKPSPAPKLEPTLAAAVAKATAGTQELPAEAWSADALADALKPERKSGTPVKAKRSASSASVMPDMFAPAAEIIAPPEPLAPPKSLPPPKEIAARTKEKEPAPTIHKQEFPPLEQPQPSEPPSAAPSLMETPPAVVEAPAEAAPLAAAEAPSAPAEAGPEVPASAPKAEDLPPVTAPAAVEAAVHSPRSTAPGAAVTPAKAPAAHEILDSILRRKNPLQSPAPKKAQAEAAPAAAAEIWAAAEITGDVASPSATPPPDTALVPRELSDPEEAAKAAMPGMGEMLADSGSSKLVPMTGTAQEARRPLNVPLVSVYTSPGEVRRARMAHLWNMGIICFILIDVLLVALAVLYWDNVSQWWKGGGSPAVHASNPAPAAAVAQSSPSPSHDAASASAPVSGDAAEAAPDSLAISVPSDFALGADAPDSGGAPATPATVPMAIPLPGHTQEDVPTATSIVPVPSEPPTPPVAEMPAPALAELPERSPAETVPPAAEPVAPAADPIPAAPAMTPASAEPAVAEVPAAPALSATLAAVDSTVDAAAVPQMPPVPQLETPEPDAAAAPADAPEAPAGPAPASTPSLPRMIVKVPAEAKPALHALEKFLDAASWTERAAFVQKADTVRNVMEKHAAAGGDGPIRAGRIAFVERYPSKAGVPPYCMFEVSGGELRHPVLALVEESKDGPRVDWEAFVEFKDDLLLRFLEKKGAPPQKFRGLLRRKHYFDKDVPEISSKDSFQLEQPNGDYEGHVFVPRSSALGKQLANQLPWGQDMPVIVELVWKSDSKAWWVQIEKIVSYGWRG